VWQRLQWFDEAWAYSFLQVHPAHGGSPHENVEIRFDADGNGTLDVISKSKPPQAASLLAGASSRGKPVNVGIGQGALKDFREGPHCQPCDQTH
jgi:hypothetical protein